MLTVEPKDLLSTRGVKQAVAVANDQALLYQNNIPFAINQATEAARNGREIYNLVLKWAVEHSNPVMVVPQYIYTILPKTQ